MLCDSGFLAGTGCNGRTCLQVGYWPGPERSLRTRRADTGVSVLQGRLSLGAAGQEAGSGGSGRKEVFRCPRGKCRQNETFNLEILRVSACKMEPVLSSHFIDLAIFPESRLI